MLLLFVGGLVSAKFEKHVSHIHWAYDDIGEHARTSCGCMAPVIKVKHCNSFPQEGFLILQRRLHVRGGRRINSFYVNTIACFCAV